MLVKGDRTRAFSARRDKDVLWASGAGKNGKQVQASGAGKNESNFKSLPVKSKQSDIWHCYP